MYLQRVGGAIVSSVKGIEIGVGRRTLCKRAAHRKWPTAAGFSLPQWILLKILTCSPKRHVPWELNGMVILEDKSGTRITVRPKDTRRIVIPREAEKGSGLFLKAALKRDLTQ